MMKLSAPMTWIVVVAFTLATTSATEQCTFKLADDSGCTASDINEIVTLLNMKLKEQSGGKGKRQLIEQEHEASTLGLRGAPEQGARKLQTNCISCQPIECRARACPGYRNLATSASSNADIFGQSLKDSLSTFRWNQCKPNKLSKMECEDV